MSNHDSNLTVRRTVETDEYSQISLSQQDWPKDLMGDITRIIIYIVGYVELSLSLSDWTYTAALELMPLYTLIKIHVHIISEYHSTWNLLQSHHTVMCML